MSYFKPIIHHSKKKTQLQILIKLASLNFLILLIFIKDLDSRGFFKPIEKKASMIDNIYSIYNKTDLSKKELRMLWGMHKKLKNQPKS